MASVQHAATLSGYLPSWLLPSPAFAESPSGPRGEHRLFRQAEPRRPRATPGGGSSRRDPLVPHLHFSPSLRASAGFSRRPFRQRPNFRRRGAVRRSFLNTEGGWGVRGLRAVAIARRRLLGEERSEKGSGRAGTCSSFSHFPAFAGWESWAERLGQARARGEAGVRGGSSDRGLEGPSEA